GVRLVPRLALLIIALGVGVSLTRQRCGGCGRDTRACAERAQELTTAERLLAFSFHRRLLLYPSLRSELLTRAARKHRFRYLQTPGRAFLLPGRNPRPRPVPDRRRSARSTAQDAARTVRDRNRRERASGGSPPP